MRRILMPVLHRGTAVEIGEAARGNGRSRSLACLNLACVSSRVRKSVSVPETVSQTDS